MSKKSDNSDIRLWDGKVYYLNDRKTVKKGFIIVTMITTRNV